MRRNAGGVPHGEALARAQVAAVSGFVAIIAGDRQRQVGADEVRKLAAAYRGIRGGDGEGTLLADERVGACVFGGPDEAVSHCEERGASWAAIAGVAHDDGPLLDIDLDRAEGHFALLRRDAETDSVTLASDPFGMFPLFVARRDGLVYAATSVLALARHLRAEPSWIGLETFLLTGFQCGTRTAWQGIERVPGGVAIQIGDDGVQKREYWRPQIDPSIRRLGLQAAADRCLEAGVAAVELCAEEDRPMWCDLTGGYDTRLLSLLARSAGLRFLTSTNGPANSIDARLARAIAQAAGWEWVNVTPPDRWDRVLPDRLNEALAWGDGALEVLQLATVLWSHELKASRARRLLNGGGGEHFWSFAWQQEYGSSERSGPVNLERWVRMRMMRAVPTAVFARDPTPDVVMDLRERMRPVIEPYLDEPRATQADILYAHKSTGHFGAYAAAAAAHLDLVLPFYTRPSFTAAVSTHPRHRFGHRLYRRMIDRLDSEIAAMPTALGGPAQPLRLSNVLTLAPYYVRLAERGFNKVTERLLGRSSRRPPGLGSAAAAAARAAAVARVGEQIGDWRSRPLYDDARLAGLLADAGRPDYTASVLLGRILTVELALREAEVTLEPSMRSSGVRAARPVSAAASRPRS